LASHLRPELEKGFHENIGVSHLQNKAPKKDNSFFPFCSERCQLIDLGKWLDGKHVIKEEEFLENNQAE